MRLVRFQARGGEVRNGVVAGDEVVDLRSVDDRIPGRMPDLLAGGGAVLSVIRSAADRASAKDRHQLSDVKLHAPVLPPTFFAIALNYAQHAVEAARLGRERPDDLMVFTKATSCVNGPYDPIERPAVSEQLDYEGELGVVIGRRSRNVPVEDAPSVVGGYLAVNDVSVRDWQRRTSQFTLGKSFDTHGPLGPWIVTPDELTDPHSLDLRVFVNGDLRQKVNTGEMFFNIWEQIAVISTACTLEPGDIISTGTPGGVGIAMDPPAWLVPGDIVRVEIDRIGALENPVIEGSAECRIEPAHQLPT